MPSELILDSVEDDHVVKLEPQSDSEEPLDAHRRSSADDDIDESANINIKIELVDEDAKRILDSLPSRPHTPRNGHEPSKSLEPLVPVLPHPPSGARIAWMIPSSQVYARHMLAGSALPPSSSIHGVRLNESDFPLPKNFYMRHECKGFVEGPTLLALHCYILHQSLPRVRIHGESLHDLAFKYLDAFRVWNDDLKTDVVGIASERLAWRAAAAVMSKRKDHVHKFVEEVKTATRKGRPDIGTRDLQRGLHGTVSMLRLMRAWVPGADALTEELAQSLAFRLTLEYFGYFDDPIRRRSDGSADAWPYRGRPLFRKILFAMPTFEEDIAVLTEIALLWPESGRDRIPYPEGTHLLDTLWTTADQVFAILSKDLASRSWSARVDEFCAGPIDKKGAWYINSCIRLLLGWFARSRESDFIKCGLEKTLIRINNPESGPALQALG